MLISQYVIKPVFILIHLDKMTEDRKERHFCEDVYSGGRVVVGIVAPQ